MTPNQILTDRLCLRPLVALDLDDLHELFAQPGVRRYLWDDEIISREQTSSVVERSIASFAMDGFGLWGVSFTDSRELIGFCGFLRVHEPPRLELLYGIAPAHWNKGLATEAAIGMIRHGFDVLGFDRVEASTDAPNAASVRVMEHAGMRFWKREMPNGLDTIYYCIDHSS